MDVKESLLEELESIYPNKCWELRECSENNYEIFSDDISTGLKYYDFQNSFIPTFSEKELENMSLELKKILLNKIKKKE